MRTLKGVLVAQAGGLPRTAPCILRRCFPRNAGEPTTVPALLTPNASTHGFSDLQPEPETGILDKVVPMSAKPCFALKLPAVTV